MHSRVRLECEKLMGRVRLRPQLGHVTTVAQHPSLRPSPHPPYYITSTRKHFGKRLVEGAGRVVSLVGSRARGEAVHAVVGHSPYKHSPGALMQRGF